MPKKVLKLPVLLRQEEVTHFLKSRSVSGPAPF
jgi:hypothetical protein